MCTALSIVVKMPWPPGVPGCKIQYIVDIQCRCLIERVTSPHSSYVYVPD